MASQARPREVHYSSVKWLTNKRFALDRKLADPQHEQFRKALHEYFGQPQIEKLQRVVTKLCRSCRKELGGKLPTAPDLWLVDRRGNHRFVEVKLPGDSVAPHQLAGMAAIASVLRGRHVSVELIQLHDDDRMFKNFCRRLANLALQPTAASATTSRRG